MNISGSTFLVTGGSSGLGAATAQRLSDHGANVVILDINEQLGNEMAEKLPHAIFVKTDVSSEEDVQNAIQTASKAANLQMLADYDAKNGPALQRMLSEGNIELRTFPPEVLNALEGFANELYEESSASSAMFAKIYEPWQTFRDNIRGFHAISEKAYLDYSIPDDINQ